LPLGDRQILLNHHDAGPGMVHFSVVEKGEDLLLHDLFLCRRERFGH
jgi:hypothetical protein